MVLMKPGDNVTQLAQDAIAAGAMLLIAGGGDGTISAVAGAVADSPAILGVLPLGTLNHFARDLKIPATLEGAIEVIRQGYTRQVDAAELNGRIFINNSSLGLYPHLVRRRERQQRLGWRKWTAFAWAAVAVFRRFPFVTVKVGTSDGTQMVRRTPLAFVGNNVYSMSGSDLGCRARLDEGTLSLFIARRRGRFGLLWMACSALLGRLERDRSLECRRVEEIVIETHGKTALVACDGETARLPTPLRYRILPGALTVLVPN